MAQGSLCPLSQEKRRVGFVPINTPMFSCYTCLFFLHMHKKCISGQPTRIQRYQLIPFGSIIFGSIRPLYSGCQWVSKLIWPIKFNSTGLQPRFMAQSTIPASGKDRPLPPSAATSGCRRPPFRRFFGLKKKIIKIKI
jgi:hypothetical protein